MRALKWIAVLVGLKAVLWWFVVRPWARDWGATADERARVIPGDEWIPEPDYSSTKAITIQAPASATWPWLVQIGRGRGGLYSIDWLDRLFRILDAPSADRILPEYQHLAPGDIIPIGGSNGWPVLHVEENRCLSLAGDENGTRWSWAFALYESTETDGTVTRLVSRNRLRIASTPARLAVLSVVDAPAGASTTVVMLRGLRRRAEGLASKRRRGGS